MKSLRVVDPADLLDNLHDRRECVHVQRERVCRANRTRIGTAELGNRDEHARLPAIGPELAVSGPEAEGGPAKTPRHGGNFCC